MKICNVHDSHNLLRIALEIEVEQGQYNPFKERLEALALELN